MKPVEKPARQAQELEGIVPTVNLAAEEGRKDFYGRAKTQNLAPLWRVLHGLVTATPATRCVPAIWHYKDVRPYLMEACKLIGAAEAERRVMVLENPGLPGQSRATQSLFAGLQIILPGEIAPAHRHTASALRFIIEGSNAFTAVAGERTMMAPGDFVITPSWTWHDHGNEGTGPMVWLDGLDMHVINMLAASFREDMGGKAHKLERPEGAAPAEFGNNLLPVDVAHRSQTSPIFNYPYRKSRESLDTLARMRAPDAWQAYKMKFINPVNGGWAMPTISTWMQLIPRGFGTAPYRSTDSAVFTVVEGRGKSTVGGETFEWGPHDIFVAPSWMAHTHQASEDAVLFIYSDRVIQEKLDIWRESKETA
jgi:gentisate 1,2-dioxygenase